MHLDGSQTAWLCLCQAAMLRGTLLQRSTHLGVYVRGTGARTRWPCPCNPPTLSGFRAAMEPELHPKQRSPCQGPPLAPLQWIHYPANPRPGQNANCPRAFPSFRSSKSFLANKVQAERLNFVPEAFESPTLLAQHQCFLCPADIFQHRPRKGFRSLLHTAAARSSCPQRALHQEHSCSWPPWLLGRNTPLTQHEPRLMVPKSCSTFPSPGIHSQGFAAPPCTVQPAGRVRCRNGCAGLLVCLPSWSA